MSSVYFHKSSPVFFFLSYLSCSLAYGWGTTVDFITSFLHSSRFSAFCSIFHSRPVHSLMFSSHHFLCLPLHLLPWTVPCRIVLASPDDHVTCPYHFSLPLFTEVKRSSYGPMAFPILAFTSSLVMWSLYEIPVTCAVYHIDRNKKRCKNYSHGNFANFPWVGLLSHLSALKATLTTTHKVLLPVTSMCTEHILDTSQPDRCTVNVWGEKSLVHNCHCDWIFKKKSGGRVGGGWGGGGGCSGKNTVLKAHLEIFLIQKIISPWVLFWVCFLERGVEGGGGGKELSLFCFWFVYWLLFVWGFFLVFFPFLSLHWCPWLCQFQNSGGAGEGWGITWAVSTTSTTCTHHWPQNKKETDPHHVSSFRGWVPADWYRKWILWKPNRVEQQTVGNFAFCAKNASFCGKGDGSVGEGSAGPGRKSAPRNRTTKTPNWEKVAIVQMPRDSFNFMFCMWIL